MSIHFRQNILSKTTQNTILSPFSLELMLSVLAEASSGNTYSEIEAVLPHIKDIPRQRVLFELALGRILVGSKWFRVKVFG